MNFFFFPFSPFCFAFITS
jgi:hypothetical protein